MATQRSSVRRDTPDTPCSRRSRKITSASRTGVGSPVTSPSSTMRPYCPRHRRTSGHSGGPTVSITTSAPASSVNASAISARSGPSPYSTTTDAPSCSRPDVLSGDVVTAITCAPLDAASRTAWLPNPPPAPVMTTVSPSATSAVSMPDSATPAGQASSAARSGATPVGTATSAVSGSATYSANPPSRPCPIPTPFTHRCSRPARHRAQLPQAAVSRLTTRSSS